MTMDVQETRFDRDMLATRFLDEVERLSAPLRGLADHQRVAVVALLAASQLMTVYDRSAAQPSAAVGNRFDRLVDGIHEGGALFGAGLRKSCLGKMDEADELQCLMTQLEAMVGALRRLRLPLARNSASDATT